MIKVRPIDANALLDHLASTLDASYFGTPHLRWKCREVEEAIRNAKTITHEVDGDAISREAVLALFPERAMCSVSEDMMRIRVGNLPALPVAPAEVTAEDVCEGIEFRIGDGVTRVQKLGVGWSMLREDDKELICLPDAMVADLLNGALRRGEPVTWPKGHRLAKPEEPTLLEELLQAYIELHAAMAKATGGIPLTTPLIRKVEAAIQRAEAEGESK